MAARLTVVQQQHPPAAGGVLARDVQNRPALASQDIRWSAMDSTAQHAQLSPRCCRTAVQLHISGAAASRNILTQNLE